jgi:branched-chain amino acid transport system permease protein
MAQGTELRPATEISPLQRALLRLPIRKIILWALSIFLLVGITLGARATLNEGVFSGADWRNLALQGLALGSLYAIIAVGYTLVYGILFMINFAHGEVFMSGAFTSFFVAREFASSGFLDDNPVLAIAILMVVACAVSMLVAITLERVAYRPLRGAPRLVPLITAIGASLFLQNTFRFFYGAQTRGYPRPNILDGRWEILGVPILRTQVISILGAAILMTCLYLFIERTKTGRSMRAVGEDKEMAALMGIDVDRVIVTTFGIGGMLAGAAGILWALQVQQVNSFMGFLPGIKAFTAAVLGGIGNVLGAGLGGIILGLLEAVGPNLFLPPTIPSPFQLTNAVAFSVLVLILIFLPGGLLGAPQEERA